jgi:hypothetical protein
MFKNRFILVVGMLALLTLTLGVSGPLANKTEPLNLSWPPRPVVEPITRSLAAYYQSERSLLDPNVGLAIYHQSERLFIDPQAGMAAYFNSERTRTPVRNLDSFNPYQQSEWFGR